MTVHLPDLAFQLNQLFPDLEPTSQEPLHLLGEGFSSTVIETAQGVVFRIAKNPTAAAGHAREARLLPVLAGRLPLAIPQPGWYAGPSANFPFGLIGYPKLSGQPLTPALFDRLDLAQLATELAAFLLALHRFPVSTALTLGLPGPAEQQTAWEQLRTDVLPPLAEALPREAYQTIERWWDTFLADPKMQDYPSVLQHGDLWYENMLVTDEELKLSGILDFEYAAIGDPAQDLTTLLYLGQPFLDQVVAAYRAGGGLLGDHFDHRLSRLWELRDFNGLQYAVRYNDSEELEDSIHKIRNGPILNPAT